MNMLEFVNEIIAFIESIGPAGALIGGAFITIESIIPILPLFAFITLNFVVFGHFFGFIISWIFTILGCIISYLIFRNGLGNWFEKFEKDKKRLSKYVEKFKHISLGMLVLIIAMPFTPAFVVNIAAGLCKMDFKKFFVSIVIGKISLVFFWGFIGSSFLESISNPVILFVICLLMLGVYILSRIVNKKLDIE